MRRHERVHAAVGSSLRGSSMSNHKVGGGADLERHTALRIPQTEILREERKKAKLRLKFFIKQRAWRLQANVYLEGNKNSFPLVESGERRWRRTQQNTVQGFSWRKETPDRRWLLHKTLQDRQDTDTTPCNIVKEILFILEVFFNAIFMTYLPKPGLVSEILWFYEMLTLSLNSWYKRKGTEIL